MKVRVKKAFDFIGNSSVAATVALGIGVVSTPLLAESNKNWVESLDTVEETATTEREFVARESDAPQVSTEASPQIRIDGVPVLTAERYVTRLYTGIPAAAFVADSGGSDDGFYYYFAGLFWAPNNGGGCMQAPVNLPNNVTVTAVWATMYDNDAAVDWTVSLQRQNVYSVGAPGSSEYMASFSTTGESTNYQNPGDETIDFPVIDNYDYNYSFTTCIFGSTSNLRLYDIRVYYDVN